MNTIETEMNLDEISKKLYSDNNDIIFIQNSDLKNYFEMLLMLFLRGLNKFCGYALVNNKYNLNLLKETDILKINSFFKKISIKLNFKIINSNTKNNIKQYDDIEINSNINIDDLYYKFNVYPNIYIINFTYIF